MPLSVIDQVRRQVLRHLLFHERSPTFLKADGDSCTIFGAPSTAILSDILVEMADCGLFRVLPSPSRSFDPVASARWIRPEESSPPGKEDFLRGVSVMLTAEGKRMYTTLKHRTRKIRQADWQDGQGKVEPGTWVRSDA